MRGGNNRAVTARRTSSSRRRRDRYTAERTREPWAARRNLDDFDDPGDCDDNDAVPAR